MTEANILITGSTGLVGMHVLYELLGELSRGLLAGKILPVLRDSTSFAASQRVDRVLHNKFVPHFLKDFTPSVRQSIHPISADLCDLASLKRAIQGSISVQEPLTVIHSAGSVNLETTQEARDDVYAHNYEGTLNLLRALDGYAIRFIYIGTVFSSGVQQGRIGDDYLSLPSHAYRNPYEESKAKVELEVARYCEEKGIRFQILRPSIICGRVMDPPLYYTPKFDVFYGWLKFFWQLKKAELHSPLRLCIHETATMNVVPVDFVAKAIVKSVHSHVGQLNIANPEAANTVEITRAALEHIGYENASFVNSIPTDLNRVEQFYYKTVGALFDSYINNDASIYDCSKLLSFISPIKMPPMREHIGGIVDFAKQFNFDDRKIDQAAHGSNGW
ncbi:MAG: SDR family oxidoreductase [Verrucomicrobia bacterium]|nr:SDR family oxidoreductase [Verrucomicrobiota bacterium]